MTDSEFWKSLGLCTKCHKRKAENGSLCDKCRERIKNNRLKREKLAKIKERKERKIITKHCYKCGNTLDKYIFKTLCDKCYEEVVIPEFLVNRR